MHLPTQAQPDPRVSRGEANGFSPSSASLDALAVTANLVARLHSTEARLMESEERFRKTCEGPAVGIGHLTRDGRWVWVNSRLCQMLDRDEQDLLETHCVELIGSEMGVTFAANLRRLLDGELRNFALEQNCARRDGTTFWALWTVSLAQRTGSQAFEFVVVVDDISLRKWTEENLVRIRAAIEGSSDAVAISNAEGKHVFQNQAFTRLFGYRVEELAEPAAHLALYADRAVGGAVVEMTSRGHPWHGETELVSRNGRRFPGELKAEIIRDEQERVIGFIRIYKEISRRKATDRRLRQLSSAVEQTASIVVITDLEGTIEYANPRFEEVTGYSLEEVLGSNPRLLKSGAMSPDAYKEMWQTINAGKTWRGRFLNRKKSGELYWESAVISPVADEHGAITHFIAVKEDITERKRVEEALAQSEERFRTLFELAPDAIYLTTLKGAFVAGNRAAERLTGYTRDELIGKNYADTDLLSPSDLVRAAAGFARNAQGEQSGPEPYLIHRKDGTKLSVEITSFPITLGEQRLVLGIARDITERKQLEAELRQAQKMEAVGQLAGGLAHDFNNILAVVQGNAEMLQLTGEQLSAEGQEYLEQILRAVQSAASLTRQLLIFSRKQVMQSQALDLNGLIKNLLKMLKRLIQVNIRLETHFAENLPGIEADPGMIEQVLMNLVVNARDAMPKGGVLKLTTEHWTAGDKDLGRSDQARTGDYVCLSIVDTGIGIRPEHLNRIYEPFFTTKEPGKGTGLGLATTYGIVRQHGGWIEVSSQVGIGTTFKVHLPAKSQPELQQGAKAAAKASRGNETVLVAEDETELRVMTRHGLEAYGYHVFEAGSAVAALEIWKLHKDEISVLVADLVMPDRLGGYGLAEQLRAEKPALGVVLMSGYSSELIERGPEFLRKQGVHFLQKPFALDYLVRTVRASLDRIGSGEPEDEQPTPAPDQVATCPAD